jgi:Zn-dependent peptidase ImmA (M78 family)
MTTVYNSAELAAVFGPKSVGDTPEKRAATSDVRFVRSQLQLAFFKPGAKGRVLVPREALEIFGWKTLRVVGLDNSAPLLRTSNEPAATLRKRREELGLSEQQLAAAAHITPDAVKRAEQPGQNIPIRELENLAQSLALDERRLGFEPGARADDELGVRLRQMTGSGDVRNFSAATVTQLAEAAWVVSRQQEFKKKLRFADVGTSKLPTFDARYTYPTWEIGYELARRTRRLLDLQDDEPIRSVRQLVESRFGIALVQQKMNLRFAGATIANGGARGIVVNEEGANSNVWVRRMTLSHELGHLLWDPDDRLQSVKVDEYSDLERDNHESVSDPPEIRANAFAIAFLAPPDAVHEIVRSRSNLQNSIGEVMQRFGISATAAKWHVVNVEKRAGSAINPAEAKAPLLDADEEWIVAENGTVDYFPLHDTPLARRGMFARYVAQLCLDSSISEDTAAAYLKTTQSNLQGHLGTVVSLWQ